MRCSCSMTALELLQSNIAVSRPLKSLLVVDSGRGWNVTRYGPDAAGLGTDHVTIQSTIEEIERCLVDLRRQSNIESVGGEVLSGAAMVRDLR